MQLQSMEESEQTDKSTTQRREITLYGIVIGGLTEPNEVESILELLRNRYWLKPIPIAYEPENGRVEIAVDPTQDPKHKFTLKYALTMSFMQGRIHSYSLAQFFSSGPKQKVSLYSREKDGRRYRVLKGKKVFIDPEPQPVEALQTSEPQPMIQAVQ